MLLYFLTLLIRHFLYDKGVFKSFRTEIPSIGIGNVSLGGSGKTPMAEHVIRTIREGAVESAEADIYGFEGSLFAPPRMEIAVVSRGYRRKSKGMQTVETVSDVRQTGDEPLQIKRKFPDVTVVVDTDRNGACSSLARSSSYIKPDLIVLDDVLQHRKTVPTKTIMLTSFTRPFFSDRLFPMGTLRDLKCRVAEADMVVVTKCPVFMDETERRMWAENIGIRNYNPSTCKGVNRKGKEQILLFSTTVYDGFKPVFPEGDPRYVHSKSVFLFTGIADDSAYLDWLCKTYSLNCHHRFGDHHFFSQRDINSLCDDARRFPTSFIVTTEKDAQRLLDPSLDVPEELRHRTFYAPIRSQMLTALQQEVFKQFLDSVTGL